MSRSPGYEKGTGLTVILQGLFYSLSRVLARRRFVGNERLGTPGAALVVANHISHIDPLFDAVFVRKAGRFPHILAKSSLWKVPVLKSVLNKTGQIPVDRAGGAGGSALDAATEALQDGKVVLIYPEGTVSREPAHWPMRPRPGVAVLALSGDFPVIPVARWGTQALYTSYQPGMKLKMFPRKEIHVVAGPPIDLSAWRGKPVDARAIRDVSYLIMNTIKEMLADLRGEAAPADLFDPKKAADPSRNTDRGPARKPGDAASDGGEAAPGGDPAAGDRSG